MNDAIRRLAPLLVLCLALAPASRARAEVRQDRHVILVSVDGLAGFYLDDSRADMPTLRRMAREGARASGMVCSFPTVTWPNHTTLVTGVAPVKHGVLGNNYLDRQTGKNVALIMDGNFDKEEIVKVPTIYDVAHQAGLKTAGVIWPATRAAKTLDWTVPDTGGEAWNKFGTQSWLSELARLGCPSTGRGPGSPRATASGATGFIRAWPFRRWKSIGRTCCSCTWSKPIMSSISSGPAVTRPTGPPATPTTGSATCSMRPSVRRWPATPRSSFAAIMVSFPSTRRSDRT